jgi:hypothetical protein
LKVFSEHSCDDRSHSHLSRSQVYEFDKHQSLEWLAIRYRRGLSGTASEYLAAAVRAREGWALAMLAQIHGRFEGHTRAIQPLDARLR